jgi:hypothetical protein
MNEYARALLGGWELAGIVNAQSGQPYTAVVNSDLNGDGNSRNERAPGTSRNQFNLPAIFTINPRITRNIRITEGVKLQLIGEAFDLFNHENVTAAKSTLYATSKTACGTGVAFCLVPQTFANGAGVNTFGFPSAASIDNNGANVGRVLQLAAKITF